MGRGENGKGARTREGGGWEGAGATGGGRAGRAAAEETTERGERKGAVGGSRRKTAGLGTGGRGSTGAERGSEGEQKGGEGVYGEGREGEGGEPGRRVRGTQETSWGGTAGP